MDGFIAIKTVTLGGVTYPEGAAIPEEAVVPKRVPALIRLKYIARVAGEDSPPASAAESPPGKGTEGECGEGTVSIPILLEKGTMVLEIELGNVGAALELLQRKADDAIAKLAEVTCDKVLILVDALDQRKTVKAAAKAQALKLEEERKAAEGTPPDSSTSSAPDGAPSPQGEGKGDGGDQ